MREHGVVMVECTRERVAARLGVLRCEPVESRIPQETTLGAAARLMQEKHGASPSWSTRTTFPSAC